MRLIECCTGLSSSFVGYFSGASDLMHYTKYASRDGLTLRARRGNLYSSNAFLYKE